MTTLRHNMAVPADARALRISNPAQRQTAQPTTRHRMRAVQFAWLNRFGETQNRLTTVPDIPAFQMAFNAFARGALVATPDGPVAVEDLKPGMMVDTVDAAPACIVWTGTTAATPVGNGAKPDYLFRITEGSYGLGQGRPDLVLGPGARLMTPGQLGRDTGRLQPVADLADGHQVVQVAPRTAVQLYHFALPSHRLVRVNDIAIESFHPGHAASLSISDDLFGQFLSLFPQIRTMAEFGPLNFLR